MYLEIQRLMKFVIVKILWLMLQCCIGLREVHKLSIPVLICLFISAGLRIVLGYIQKDVWKINFWKYFIIVPLMTVLGTLGAKTASWIAYGRFSGTRLYGTVIAVGIFGAVLAIMLCVPYRELYGFSSVGTWLSIAVMKIPCIIEGCCAGRVLFVSRTGNEVLFPSQIVETVVAALFFLWFYRLSKNGYLHGAMYPLLMVWYGIYRYAVDWMRGHPLEQSPFVLWIPAGRFFSILILVIGLVTLLFVLRKKYGPKMSGRIYIDALFGKCR